MDAFQRLLKIIERCRKAIWKSLNKTCPHSCFVRILRTRHTTDNVMLRQESTAIEIDERAEVERFRVPAPSITEERDENIISNTEEQLRNDNRKARRKRKRANKKCRNNMTSQNATTEHIGDIIDDDGPASLDPSPKSPVEGTALVESGTNVSPTVESNGLEEGNEHMTSNTNGQLRIDNGEGRRKRKRANKKRRNNMTSQNATTDDIGDIINGDEKAPLEPSPRSPVEPQIELMAAVNDEPIEADRIPSETSSKKEEVKTKGKKTNKKRRIYVKPLIVTEKRTWQLDKDHVTL